MKRLVVLTVLAIGVLTGGLALYLFWAGTLLNRIATNLEESADLVHEIDDHAKGIGPDVARVNRIAGVVAGALPLLYGMAEQIVRRVASTPTAPEPAERSSRTAGTRRSRLHEGVGFTPPT
ncbi:MAG: hypothetical protein J2P28_07495 [Actinobacteria bacterium]|nr:hypothetical protein [Actinomycetota bacterium]MBO0835350.1 hypothetical protein [Actinomycetota bacterium]